MNISDPLVLRSDVVLAPVTELSAEVRAKIEYEEGDYALSRIHGRITSQIIDAETASLLQLFREPTTIVDAVIRNSRELAKDPQRWLDELLPHIGMFIQNKVLVPAGEDEEKETRQLVESGARVGPWEVVYCVNQMEDSEIYRVRREDAEGAMKMSRGAADVLLDNEEEVLRWLGQQPPDPSARLLDSGVHEGHRYLVVEWCEGAEATVAARYAAHDRAALLSVCIAIATAYAELHERTVIHGDVHVRNIIVAGDRSVRLIDFGLSRIDGRSTRRMPRGGMYYFFEPEYLAALQEGWQLDASYAGEQYALGALLYFVVTGSHYLDFRYEREEMMRQSRTEAPVPFAARKIPPWPEVEAILFRALEKDPAKRFGSVRELAEALRGVKLDDMPAMSDEANAFVEEEIAAIEYPLAPKASVNYGAAGAALGILRIASVRSDPKLLALAEVWRSRAARFVGSDEGWYDGDDAPPSMIGSITPYHTAAGLHAVTAMLAWARGDSTTQRQAAQAFVEASRGSCDSLDLTLGHSGTLLAAALLHPLGCDVAEHARAKLADIWSRLDSDPSTYVGVAHGRSGIYYAVLRWCLASGDPLPEDLERRLDELAALRGKRGRGAWWPRLAGSGARDMMPGWCNGAGGHVFTWTSAYDAFGDEKYLRLAEEAAWNAWEEPLHHADLCCGSAGRAYSLLNLYKHTGERAWLARARQLADYAARTSRSTAPRAHALWKGDLGVAVLLADLESPETAAMPLFEP